MAHFGPFSRSNAEGEMETGMKGEGGRERYWERAQAKFT